MLRSVSCCGNKLCQKLFQPHPWSVVLGQLSITHPAYIVPSRPVTLFAARWAGQGNKRPKIDALSGRDEGSPVSSEMEEAVEQAAKSLPGEWTKTAEELVTRLKTIATNGTAVETSSTEDQQKGKAASLLSTMRVGRTFEKGQGVRRRTKTLDNMEPQSIFHKVSGDRPHGRTRPTQQFNNLFDQPPLGIFKPQKDRLALVSEGQEDADDLWVEVERERVRRVQGGLPRNAFEEMIRLTEQGKVWTFPVDNEADLHEERKYKFHDHIFLERHLSAFPSSGPVRKFMELVCTGLSQNPWLSVPEKLDHIGWFENYFREKQDVLESSLGEKGLMGKEQ